jgi:hypothetical protein
MVCDRQMTRCFFCWVVFLFSSWREFTPRQQPWPPPPDLAETLSGFLATCAAAPSRSVPLTAQDTDLVSAMLAKTTSVDDPVFAAFRGKIVAAVARMCSAGDPSMQVHSSHFDTLHSPHSCISGLSQQLLHSCDMLVFEF